MKNMKNMFSDAVEGLKNIQISKHYDCETKIQCAKCEGSPFICQKKGDISVNGTQLLIVCAVISVFCISTAIVRKIRH